MRVTVGEDEWFPVYDFEDNGIQQIEIEIDEKEFAKIKSIYAKFEATQKRIKELISEEELRRSKSEVP
jgi:hypothetical protein